LEAAGGSVEQQSIDNLLLTAGEGAQLGGQGEGHQIIRAGQQAAALLLQPALGLLAVVLGAVPIAAGVIAKVERAAMLAAIDLSTQRCGAALQDGLEIPLLAGQNSLTVTLLWPGGADNVRCFEHESPLGSKAPSQSLKRLGYLGLHLDGQVGANGRGGRIAMAQNLLNQAQLHPRLQQVGGVGMAQGMDTGRLA
jgi:hypothetical protein